MKKVFIFRNALWAVALLAFLFLTACSKDKDDSPSPSSGSELKATVNGAAWSASQISALRVAAVGAISISAVSGNNSAITLVFEDDVKAGTLTIDDFDATYSSANNPMLGMSGKATITKHDVAAKRIEGTFEFEATNVLTNNKTSIKGGSFKVTYQ